MYGHGDFTRESEFLREMDKSLLDQAGDAVHTPNPRTQNRLGVRHLEAWMASQNLH